MPETANIPSYTVRFQREIVIQIVFRVLNDIKNNCFYYFIKQKDFKNSLFIF